ncbi:MAG: hypothetical protein ACHQ52_12250, partial [Candidatus Eisenbacteria bacterium]
MQRPAMLLALGTLIALALPAAEANAQERPAPRFAVHAARLIDGRAATARGPVWVVVSGDTVESVQTSAPAGVPTIELGDATLLPGLIDCHTHMCSGPGMSPRDQMKWPIGRYAILA